MNSKLTVIVFIFSFGCGINIPDPAKQFPVGAETAIAFPAAVISNTDSLTFEVQMEFIDGGGHYDLGFYPHKPTFTFTSPGSYTVYEMDSVSISPTPPAAAAVLVDESGDYQLLDPYNFRSKMINKFCQQVQAPGSFLIGGFSRQGSIRDPVEYSAAALSTDVNSQLDFLFGLPGRTGGKSSLYDAIFQSMDKLAANSSTNKNLIVLVHAGDDGSSASLTDIIDKAVTNQVKIHILFLGTSDAAGAMSQISGLTGGFFASLPTDKELITTLSQLYRLLCGDKFTYKMKVNYVPAFGTLVSGSEVVHTMQAHATDYKLDFNPMVVYTRVP